MPRVNVVAALKSSAQLCSIKERVISLIHAKLGSHVRTHQSRVQMQANVNQAKRAKAVHACRVVQRITYVPRVRPARMVYALTRVATKTHAITDYFAPIGVPASLSAGSVLPALRAWFAPMLVSVCIKACVQMIVALKTLVLPERHA